MLLQLVVILFDPRTTFLIAGILYIVMPAVTWMTLHRHDARGAAFWCAGGVLFGLGLILVGMRNGTDLDNLTLPLSSLVLGVAMALRLHALWSQTRPRISLVWPLGFAIVQASIYESLRQFGDVLAHVVWAQSVMAAMLALLAHAAWELDRREQLPGARWISIAYALASVLVLGRLLAVIVGTAPASPVANAFSGQLLAAISVLTSVFTNIGFLGIYLERSTRQRMRWEAEQARRHENARLLSQFDQLDRQRGLGRMASSMAHELGQPLTFLQLHAERMQLQASRGQLGTAQLQQDLQEMLDQTSLAAAILDRTRKFGHARPGPLERLSLQALVQDALTLMKDWLQHEDVQVRVQALPCPPVQVDRVALTQGVLNLVRNAAQAMRGRDPRAIDIQIAPEADGVRLRIEDCGPGFSPEALEKAGRQTFSTKQDGMGLGLSIVHVIADQHGGRLQIGNTPQGAQVELWLPASSAQNAV